jgi:hypothetical protein
MTSSRIKIWKFVDAPKKLQSLYHGSSEPQWVTLVPRGLGGRDLDQAISRSAAAAALSRCSMANGDIVYIGASHIASVFEVMGEMAHASSRAALSSAKAG